jgi:DNA polymerase-3 subunit gamma/tau
MAGPDRQAPGGGPEKVSEGQLVAAPKPGGIDTDAIRRSWPDILAKIFSIRRTTWTFLSEHTQVLDYDGTRLLLGIQTEGLTATFRRGQHGELVRQALIEVLGVEAVVEGIPTAESSRPRSPTAAPVPPAAAARGAAPAPSAPPAPGTPATHQVAHPVAPDPDPPAAPPERPSTPRQRATAAVAQEVRARGARSSSSVADDSMVSADDEDIEETGAVGQPVIARVLGGTVIGELDQ